MPNAYEAAKVEAEWYKWWESNKFFRDEKTAASKEKFSMVLPPPNITGTLHLGHALTCAIQDSLVSWYVNIFKFNLKKKNLTGCYYVSGTV